jgi:hypothetical protein
MQKIKKPSQELDISAGNIFSSTSKGVKYWRERKRVGRNLPLEQGKKMKD